MSTPAEVEQPPPEPVRWGVLAASARVAQSQFLPAVSCSARATLVAVASRSHPDGSGYDRFGAASAYGSYEELLADDEVEVVYLPLPNGLHAEWAVRAAEAGKHVLCETPLATRAAEASEMADVFDELGVVLMVADARAFDHRWTALADLLRSRRLGALRFARAVFTTVVDLENDFRGRPETGGGVILDLGTPCLAALVAASGKRAPVNVAGGGFLGRSGIDVSFSGWMDFDKGFTASFDCSFQAPPRQLLEFTGTEGCVTLERGFTPGVDEAALQLAFRDGTTDTIDIGGVEPYRELIEHAGAVLREGAPPRITPAESVDLLRLAERLREAAAWAW